MGRRAELEVLERAWGSPKFELTVIYGRRRVGKTRLIREYIEDKPAVYFMALESDAQLNLAGLSAAFARALTAMGGGARSGSGLPGGVQAGSIQSGSGVGNTLGLRARHETFEDFFADVAQYAAKYPLVLVIDEFPYLAQAFPPISSLLQRFCDADFAGTHLHLILCGSSMSSMERQVLSAKSPLYGRRTGQIRLQPFDFVDTEDFLAPMNRQDAALIYAATGGVADYLNFVDPSLSAGENLVRLFFEPAGRLMEEPGNLLKQELREPKRYSAILSAIAQGASKNNQIATKTGIPSGGLTNYLDALIDLGIIVRETPWGVKGGRGAVYRIQDGCFRFWYRFVFGSLSLIELGAGAQAFEAAVRPELASFMGPGFEQIVVDLFDRDNAAGRFDVLYQTRGRWWRSDPVSRQAEEIDLVAQGRTVVASGEGAGGDVVSVQRARNVFFFAEAKWVGSPVGVDVLETLQRRSRLVKARGASRFAIYAKNGFTPQLQELAKTREDLLLYQFLKPEYPR